MQIDASSILTNQHWKVGLSQLKSRDAVCSSSSSNFKSLTTTLTIKSNLHKQGGDGGEPHLQGGTLVRGLFVYGAVLQATHHIIGRTLALLDILLRETGRILPTTSAGHTVPTTGITDPGHGLHPLVAVTVGHPSVENTGHILVAPGHTLSSTPSHPPIADATTVQCHAAYLRGDGVQGGATQAAFHPGLGGVQGGAIHAAILLG